MVKTPMEITKTRVAISCPASLAAYGEEACLGQAQVDKPFQKRHGTCSEESRIVCIMHHEAKQVVLNG